MHTEATNTSWRLSKVQNDQFMRTRNTLETQETQKLRCKSLTVNNGKNSLLYFSGNFSKTVNDVGIMIESNWQIDFKPMLVRYINVNKDQVR